MGCHQLSAHSRASQSDACIEPAYCRQYTISVDATQTFLATVSDSVPFVFKWAQKFYFINFGDIVLDELSPQPDQRLVVIVSENYYGIGLDGRGMRVPSDLDESLYRYQHLPVNLKGKLDRAAYWMSMARRQWSDSMSASFAAVVIAAEALAGDGTKLNVEKKFHDFF
jgi:hypothetical protein